MKRMVETKAVALIEDMTANGVTPEMILNPKMEDIVDADGHKRFINIPVTKNELVEGAFAAAVLSGNVLKIVLRGTVVAEQTIPASTKFIQITKENLGWIYDKIAVNTQIGANFVMTSEITLYSSSEYWKYSANMQKSATELFIENAGQIVSTGSGQKGFNLEMTLIIE